MTDTGPTVSFQVRADLLSLFVTLHTILQYQGIRLNLRLKSRIARQQDKQLDRYEQSKTWSARSSKYLISINAFAGREQDLGPDFGPETNGGHAIAEQDTSIFFVQIAIYPD